MGADRQPRHTRRREGYRLGWDYEVGEFVIYLDEEEVARMSKKTSNSLLEEIRTRDANGDQITTPGKS
jgi:hypothetical protein